MGEKFSEPGVFPAGRKNSFALEHSPTSVFIYECVFWIKGAQQDFLSFHGHLICFALLFLSFPARTLCHRPAPLCLLPLRPLTGAAQGLVFFLKKWVSSVWWRTDAVGRSRLLWKPGWRVDTQSLRGQAEWEFGVALRGLSRFMYSTLRLERTENKSFNWHKEHGKLKNIQRAIGTPRHFDKPWHSNLFCFFSL